MASPTSDGQKYEISRSELIGLCDDISSLRRAASVASRLIQDALSPDRAIGKVGTLRSFVFEDQHLFDIIFAVGQVLIALTNWSGVATKLCPTRGLSARLE